MNNKSNNVDISRFKNLYPFESHFIDRNGLNYHYLDEGSGEPVVMLHGNPTWSFYYRNLVKDLSSDYRTIVPDHMGCGLSDKPSPDRYDYVLKSRVDDLDALITSLDIKDKITLVLHDWGGMIGSAYALRYPEKISRMVITNTAAFFTPMGGSLPIRLWLIRHIAPFAKVAVLGFNVFSFAALYMATHKGLSKEVKAGLAAPYNSWKNRIATLKFVQDIPVKPGDPSYALVDKVQSGLHVLSSIPKLILWGEHDFVFTLAFLEEWKRRFPDAEVHRFPEAGHYVLEDVPDKIIPLVRNFLGKNPVHKESTS